VNEEEEERRSSFGDALLLKPHEAVDDGGVAAGTVGGNDGREQWVETVGGNGGSEAVGAGKVAAAAVRRCSTWPGCLCSDYETDGWAPRSFDFFFQFIQNQLNFKNSKWVPYLVPKIPNVCMRLSWDITNMFLNCADINRAKNLGSDSTFEI
jgi:hypothetical protein